MERIPDPLSAVARLDSERPFIVSPESTVTYGEADQRVNYAVAALLHAGLAERDRIAIYDPERVVEADSVLRDIMLMLACWRIGIVAVPLSRRLPSASIPRVLKEFGGALQTGEGPLDPDRILTRTKTPAEPSLWQLDRAATILLTSGTSAQPKAAMHTLGNHVWSARGWQARVPLTPNDRWMLDLSLNHVAGLSVLFRCVLAGAAIVLPDRSMPLEDAVPRLGVTCLSFVSTQLRRALESRATLDHLKLLLLGGSAFSTDMLREARDRGWPISMSYGLTEMASTVAATPIAASAEALSTAGTVLPHRDVRLAEEGEILVRGPARFVGYVARDNIERPFDADGWFDTGDLGEWQTIDGRSMLRVIGRKDNLFVSGGENVKPEAIERVLLRQPGVVQTIVIAQEDTEFGARPVAFVKAEAWEPESWARVVAAELPRFMVPDQFHAWPPDIDLAKPSRVALARKLEDDQARQPIPPAGKGRS